MRIGFDGKLPSRGDFVGRGLPRSFLAPWQRWVAESLAASREALGSAWLDAWMVAPVWRFALRSGACGPGPAFGAVLPSIDQAGRHYPLTVACVLEPDAPMAIDAEWLREAEDAACQALAHAELPEQLQAALAGLPEPRLAAEGSGEPGWWTDGSPNVQPVRLPLAALPPPGTFAAMLDDRTHCRE